jgi:hypothetical protein
VALGAIALALFSRRYGEAANLYGGPPLAAPPTAESLHEPLSASSELIEKR